MSSFFSILLLSLGLGFVLGWDGRNGAGGVVGIGLLMCLFLQDDDGAYGEAVAGYCEVVGAGEGREGC